MKSIVILISWRGSNMNAILDAGLPANIAAVISNNPDAPGLEFARTKGIPTGVVDHRNYAGTESFSEALRKQVDAHQPDLVVLAGFMRVLSEAFVNHYAERLLNIHPALLPAFAGLDPHGRALQAGVKVSGCTVHFVTPHIDQGPIIVQAAVPVHADDTEATLSARILEQEHRIYPQAIRWFVEDKLSVQDGRVKLTGVKDVHRVLISPGIPD
ncbi:MAG: phosphoribosylglycinamide formyltransferase [Burkholderiales bacterium]